MEPKFACIRQEHPSDLSQCYATSFNLAMNFTSCPCFAPAVGAGGASNTPLTRADTHTHARAHTHMALAAGAGGGSSNAAAASTASASLLVSLVGSGFGASEYSGSARVAATVCLSTRWLAVMQITYTYTYTHTYTYTYTFTPTPTPTPLHAQCVQDSAVSCAASNGIVLANTTSSLLLTVTGRWNSRSNGFTYDGPIISQVRRGCFRFNITQTVSPEPRILNPEPRTLNPNGTDAAGGRF